MEFKDKIMLQCFRDVKCKQISLREFDSKYMAFYVNRSTYTSMA